MEERKWIVCAFVDIRGFGTWAYRAAIPQEIKTQFIRDYLLLTQHYIQSHPSNHFKYLGDGFLAIKEFSSSEKRGFALFEFIKGLRCITRKIHRLIKSDDIHPDGIRVRITDGMAYKFMVIDPNDEDRFRMMPEYIEYCINTAERLMEVNPEIVCITTESVAKTLGSYRQIFRVRKLGPPSCYPKSVNREDLETLQVLKF